MVDFDSIGRRLRESRDALGLSQTEMAEAVLAGGARGATRQTQSNYEKGERMPDAGYLAVAADLGVDVLYVLTGRREKKAQPASSPPPVRPDTTHPRTPVVGGAAAGLSSALLVPTAAGATWPLRLPVVFEAGGTKREYQVIPRFRVSASAGKASAREVQDDQVVVDADGVMALDRSFMRDQLGSDKPGFVTVTVKGESMERTLIDGETIIIDSDVTEVDASGIYVVQVGKNLLVKRLVLRMNGGLLVKSDNPAYAVDDQEFTAEEAQHIRVMGRMVWPKFR